MHWHRMRLFNYQRGLRLAMAWLLALALAGCSADLLSKLSESEANEVVSALLQAGLEAEKKTPDGGKSWSVTVDKAHVVDALSVLRAQGLPRERSANLGDIFKKDGLLSTPTEERVRFIFGLSKELEQTLAKIDGVVVARVHVVLPNNDPLAKEVKPSSASVFIKHNNDLNPTTVVPAVKNLVMRSVEGLSYETVNVTLVPTSRQASVRAASAAHAGTAVLWAVGGVVVVCLLALLGWWVWTCRPQWLPQALRRTPAPAA
jgi:type III secretion protein J